MISDKLDENQMEVYTLINSTTKRVFGGALTDEVLIELIKSIDKVYVK